MKTYELRHADDVVGFLEDNARNWVFRTNHTFPRVGETPRADRPLTLVSRDFPDCLAPLLQSEFEADEPALISPWSLTPLD